MINNDGRQEDRQIAELPGRPLFDPQVFIDPLDNPIDHFEDP